MIIRSFSAAFLVAVALSSAQAQSSRTWVSGVGNDALENGDPSPCSRTLPCKTFQQAHNQTLPGGEINVIDGGGYGTVTISKSITIDGTGSHASILSAGTNGITVNAGAADVVIIRNLSINGANTGTTGIRFLNGSALQVENTVIFGCTGAGIDFRPAASAALMVRNSRIRRCNGGGIYVRPAAGMAGTAKIEKTAMESNLFGLRVDDGGRVTVRDSVASGNTANGFIVASSAATVQLNIDECVSSNNAQVGVKAVGDLATIRLSNVTVTNNATGLQALNGADIVSFGTNQVAGNTPGGDGAATITQSQQ